MTTPTNPPNAAAESPSAAAVGPAFLEVVVVAVPVAVLVTAAAALLKPSLAKIDASAVTMLPRTDWASVGNADRAPISAVWPIKASL